MELIGTRDEITLSTMIKQKANPYLLESILENNKNQNVNNYQMMLEEAERKKLIAEAEMDEKIEAHVNAY